MCEKEHAFCTVNCVVARLHSSVYVWRTTCNVQHIEQQTQTSHRQYPTTNIQHRADAAVDSVRPRQPEPDCGTMTRHHAQRHASSLGAVAANSNQRLHSLPRLHSELHKGVSKNAALRLMSSFTHSYAVSKDSIHSIKTARCVCRGLNVFRYTTCTLSVVWGCIFN